METSNKAKIIKDLREITQAGMNDCKSALEESNYDLQKAADIIKVKGLNIVSVRQSKIAAEGVISIKSSNNRISMVEVNCQTDFVAKGDNFINFVNEVSDALQNGQSTPDPAETITKTRENIVVRRTSTFNVTNENDEKLYSYLHPNAKIGVILKLNVENYKEDECHVDQLAEDILLQIAAMNPICVSRDQVPQDEKDRQQNIFLEQIKDKPVASHPKIMEGKFNKWYQEVCLLDQESISHPKKSVQSLVDEFKRRTSADVGIEFSRFQVGQGIQKEESNFVEDVNKLVG